uniref:Uncharacterized protein n=1 Tax=Eutreptiella gymnastica TaxID=73025 RepID=A0A7S4CU03_9EUGL
MTSTGVGLTGPAQALQGPDKTSTNLRAMSHCLSGRRWRTRRRSPAWMPEHPTKPGLGAISRHSEAKPPAPGLSLRTSADESTSSMCQLPTGGHPIPPKGPRGGRGLLDQGRPVLTRTAASTTTNTTSIFWPGSRFHMCIAGKECDLNLRKIDLLL